MISLLALAIALLTLLAPSSTPEPAQRSDDVPHAKLAEENGRPTARWAGHEEAILPLLGAWQATVTFADGASDVTNLEIERAVESETDASVGLLSFGPASERFRGLLTAQRDEAGVIFASQATCQDPLLGTATLTGRTSGSTLEGTAFLPDQQHLVTWTAERIA
ncbi:hypothetical protein Poly30_38150 [Planctomycetes bacterium Poly30]|uniref:DUF1579 domain-containing protein n=1 Tax=Saltatorellus ferox TaxID=2528018 RepID=A0A518EW31_9BACT|nr:hypothetical protein Poly30_38150 [Planctomycetes bacterium Poly30]